MTVLLKPGKRKSGRKTKYGNISCRCNQKHIHRSRFEGTVCNDLHIEYGKYIKNRSVKIETEKRFDMVVSNIKICCHYIDFFITFKDGRELAVEAKGAITDVWRIKRKLFNVLYPSIKYEVRYYK